MKTKESEIFPPGEPPAAAQPATEQLKAWEQLDALVGIFEEHIENVEFMRRMRGGLADNEAEMPATNLFKAELEVMRRCVSSLHPPASAVQPARDFQEEKIQEMGRVMFALMDELKAHGVPFSEWADATKMAFSEALIDPRPLTEFDLTPFKSSAVSPREEPK